jgi:hypothetical protein
MGIDRGDGRHRANTGDRRDGNPRRSEGADAHRVRRDCDARGEVVGIPIKDDDALVARIELDDVAVANNDGHRRMSSGSRRTRTIPTSGRTRTTMSGTTMIATLGLTLELALIDGLRLGEALALLDTDGDREAESELLGLVDADGLTLADVDTEGDRLADGLTDADALALGDRDVEGLIDAELDALGDVDAD